MSNKKEKPVWRLNTGNGVPSDYEKNNVYRKARGIGTWWVHANKPVVWEIYGDENDIYAYQTNRTRQAKYR